MPPMTPKTDPAQDYASYLVRFWREDPAQPNAHWQAQLEWIQTGQSWHFASREELLAFLAKAFPAADPCEKP